MMEFHSFRVGRNLLAGSGELRALGEVACDYFVLATEGVSVAPGAWEELTEAVAGSRAAMVYSDYYVREQGEVRLHPTIECQVGSLRDDFDFGEMVFFRADLFRQAVREMRADYRYAALYDVRLRLSRLGEIVRLPRAYYTVEVADTRASGEKQFDYVNPRNREVQVEMEAACTEHLRRIGAWLPPRERRVATEEEAFAQEATVVIPVRNRVKTIADAVRSALGQELDKPFNVIVVDNHSTDGTTEVLRGLAAEEPRLVHHIPRAEGLGIGGCWNEAVRHAQCGRYAVQLDSDDLYNSPHTLQRIVDMFRREGCAMVIGSYEMVDFQLQPLPPGLIDHREWTQENGHNNALRINGLGAPRAFYTPVVRSVGFPDVSYGEDYAVGLAISREYRIGRIYEPLYLCRRWPGNSDANLDIERQNAYHHYKDQLRSREVAARQAMNEPCQRKS